MSKYEPLGKYLSEQNRSYIPLSFREIELILGRKLPPSKSQRAWWSNNPTNNVMTKQWLDAGYETESVDIAAQRLVFRKKSRPDLDEGDRRMAEEDDLSDPLFGCMKGTMTPAPDLDLTAPADPDWGAVYDDR